MLKRNDLIENIAYLINEVGHIPQREIDNFWS